MGIEPACWELRKRFLEVPERLEASVRQKLLEIRNQKREEWCHLLFKVFFVIFAFFLLFVVP